MAGLPLPSTLAAASSSKDVEMKDDDKAASTALNTQSGKGTPATGGTGTASGGGAGKKGKKKKGGKK